MERFFAIFIALAAASFATAADQGTHLFILSGQSNMAGLNPAISFSPTVEAAFGKEHVLVVKDAQSGQPILRWVKAWKPVTGNPPAVTGDLYEQLMKKVNAAIQGKEVKTVTFVWMQGERDAKTGQSGVYEASLKSLVQQLRTDLKRPDMNFVIGRLSDHLNDNAEWAAVRKIQVAVADGDPRGAWVNTDDLNDKPGKNGALMNDLHYSADGYATLGQRFAEKAIALINAPSLPR